MCYKGFLVFSALADLSIQILVQIPLYLSLAVVPITSHSSNNSAIKANSVVEVFTGYMIFAFMALLFLQVLMRFIFKHPIYGIDECVTALMIWSMCLGWCTVYWDNGHAVLEFIMNRMPKAFRRGMFTFTNFLIVVISWVYIPASWQLFQMQKKMPPVGGLPISKGYYYALPVLVMGVIMLVMSAYKAIAFVITGDESICVPVEKEGGGLLD